MSEFIRRVEASMDPLVASGVVARESSQYDEQVFGNVFVIFRGKNYRVRFVRDRGDVGVDVVCRHRPEKWVPIQRTLAALDVSGPPEAPIEVDVAVDLCATTQRSYPFGPARR